MLIEAKDLYLSYDNKKLVIKKANFFIRQKEFVFISGVSGSGKSTLLKSLYGDLKVQNGLLFVDGINLSNVNNKILQELRRKIGIVFQDYKLVNDLTIEENILLPLKINGYSKEVSYKQTIKLLKHVDLLDRAKAYPKELSGGEQQRVAVARALAKSPKIILADEPTGNLDEFSASMIWKLLKGANSILGITVIVVTHKIPEDFGYNFRQYSLDKGGVYEVY